MEKTSRLFHLRLFLIAAAWDGVGMDGWGWVGWWGFDGWKRTKGRLRRKKTAPVGVGVGGCVGVSIEGRAQNIAPLQVGG